jgi:hypothetical protein
LPRPIAIISGALANKPANGGNAWTRLSWLLGFQRLGFEVYFVEQIASGFCVDRSGQPTPFENSENLAFFRSTMRAFGLDRSSSLILDDGRHSDGLPIAELLPLVERAAFLFNISGHLTYPELLDRIGKKIYFDDDPGFTQFWHASGTSVRLTGHDHFFTIGENIGEPDCPIPVGNIPWRHTRCPVVLDQWPAKDLVSTRPPQFDRFTTVASWRGPYGPITFGDQTYGLKVHQFRKFIELPRRSPHKFEIALDIHPADQKDLDALLAHGWQVAPPRAVADSAQSFRIYVQNSGAEFSVAQGVYTDTNSGWFSDRTVRYLASSRPALVQDTGFGRHLPTGEGLLAFRTLDEALAGADRIATDYQKHCRTAREIAEQYFDSDKIISRLLSEVAVPLPEQKFL